MRKPLRFLLLPAVLAILTAPFLWTRTVPDFATGLVGLRAAPREGWQFLSIVLPGLAIGGAIAALGRLWSMFVRRPLVETTSHRLFESPRNLALVAVALT